MLLDTHVWVWTAAGARDRIGPKTRRVISRAAAEGRLHVSAVSAFEIAALHTAHRLKLTQPVGAWIHESIERGRLRLLDVNAAVAIDAGAIRADALADPIDRLLVATARDAGLRLLTADHRILDYARRTGLVRTVDASA